MEQLTLPEVAARLFLEIERLLPKFRAVAEDAAINEGNVAVVVIGPAGEVFGHLFGTDRIRQRNTAGTAWKKASQVWLTGIATGEYERRVYNGEVDWAKLGVMKPDLVGWEGGLPIRLADGSMIAVGFSGFRGETDAAIIRAAVAAAGLV